MELGRTTRQRGRALVVLLVAALLLLGAPPAFAEPTGPAAHSQELVGFALDDNAIATYQAPTLQYPSADHVQFLGPPPDPTDDPVQAAEFDAYLSQLGDPKQYPPGSEAHFWAAWKRYSAKNPNADFALWRTRYRTITNNRQLGKGTNGFEKFVLDHAPQFKDANGWTFDKTVPKSGSNKRPDAYHPDRYYICEFKSGHLDNRAENQILDFVKTANAEGKMVQVVFREPPNADDLAAIERITKAAPQNAGRSENDLVKVVELRIFPANVVATTPPDPVGAPKMPTWLRSSPGAAGPPSAAASGAPSAPPPASGGAGKAPGGAPVTGPAGGGGAAPAGGSLAAEGQHQVSGGLATAVAESPDNATIAAMQHQMDLDILAEYAREFGEDFAPTLDAPKELGGVDFSTLQLRYVSDSYQGHAAQFAFKADAAPADQPAYGGRQAAQLASDSFFVWLALPPSAFTVNLNPDEPDRIIDARFGQTDAGRVLLEADLQMKKSVATFINPDTPRGRQFWDALRGDDKCLSMRQWIVPGTATVRETGDELYILDAPLTVKMETDYVKAKGVGGVDACTKDPTSAAYNEQLYRTTILPLVQKAVNEAPEYADLRRVYFSRVAAQWYRDRSEKKHTAYSDVIDTGNIGPWISHAAWSPKDTYDRYVKSYTEGEFKKQYTNQVGNTVYTYTYVYGGVDFTTINKHNIGASAFASQQPALPRTVAMSNYGPTTVGDRHEVWLGGLTADRPIQDLPATPPARAPSKTVFYVLIGLPLVVWLGAGGWLLVRRLSANPGGAR